MERRYAMWLLKRWRLSFEQIDEMSLALAEEAHEYLPEVVVSIDNGGRYVGAKVARALQVPHLSVLIRRDIYRSPTLNRFPAWMKMAIQLVLFSITEPVVVRGLRDNDLILIRGKRVLLVDNVIASGKTLDVGMRLLCAAGSIRTAVICSVSGRLADYYLIEGRYSYPWSRTSPEYKKFLSYLEATAP